MKGLAPSVALLKKHFLREGLPGGGRQRPSFNRSVDWPTRMLTKELSRHAWLDSSCSIFLYLQGIQYLAPEFKGG